MRIVVSENQYEILRKLTNEDIVKASLVKDDLADFYRTLENAIKKGGISEQSKKDRVYQKEVESLQIGLMLLGYNLPKHGVDGLFGPETAGQVIKFTKDNVKDNILKSLIDKFLSEAVSEYDPSGSVSIESGVDASLDDNLQNLIDKIQSEFGLPITISSGQRDPKRNASVGGTSNSAHLRHNAVDIMFEKNKQQTLRFIEIASKLGAGGIGVYGPGFVHIDLEGIRAWGKNHTLRSVPNWANDVIKKHLSGVYSGGSKINPSQRTEEPEESQETQDVVTATPKMLEVMIKMLKSKNITSSDIKKFTTSSSQISTSFIGTNDDDFYKTILKCIGAPVSKENMLFFYAWRQSEGASAKNNPLNTTMDYPNATSYNRVGVKNYRTKEDGIDATCKTLKLNYYTCIVNGLRGDIGAKRISEKCSKSLNTWGTGLLLSKVLDGYIRGAKPKPPKIAS